MSPAPAGPYLPTTELVAEAWLGQRVPGIVQGQVATTLPKPSEAGVISWADEGFVQVQALPGGPADVDLPQWRRAVCQLDFWAATPSGKVPPWALANRLVELVRAATETQAYGGAVTLREGYLGARVQAAYFETEPRRVLDDPAGYARFTVDAFALDWVRA